MNTTMSAQSNTFWRGRAPAASQVSPPEEYFRGVSPLCRRLLDDMKAVRESWGDDWHHMSYQQQCRVIDQAIVDEATVRRYDGGGVAAVESGPECEYFPKLKLTTGQKVVCDENLSARGFSCSWRDEHSAPFSWHTRSQMDLTLDTPPATPTHPGTPVEAPTTTLSREGRVIPGGRAVYTARPVSLPKPPRFRWHYDTLDEAPDPPSVVVAAPRSSTLSQDVTTENKKSPTSLKYMLVRGRGEEGVGMGAGLLNRLRGAVAALTATCLPLRPSTGVSLFPGHREVGKESEVRSDLQQPPRPGHNTATSTLTTTITNLTPGEAYEGDCSTLPSLSRLSQDPTLSGYVCSLPDDDDDMPYTAAKSTTTTATAYHDPSPKNNTCEASRLTAESLAATCTSLPTPLPTPTFSDEAQSGDPPGFPPLTTSTASSPRPPLASLENSFSLASEPDSTLDALDTPREEQPLLSTVDGPKERPEDDTDDLFKSVLSSKRESNIPKTGFDFLDNW